MKKPKLFYLHNDNYRLIERLSDEQAGKVFKTIYRYASRDEKEDTGDILIDTVADMFTMVISRQYEEYDKKCEKMRANALKRYNKKAQSASVCKSREDKDNNKDKDKYKDKDEDEDKDKDKEKNKKEKEKEDKEKKEREEK